MQQPISSLFPVLLVTFESGLTGLRLSQSVWLDLRRLSVLCGKEIKPSSPTSHPHTQWDNERRRVCAHIYNNWRQSRVQFLSNLKSRIPSFFSSSLFIHSSSLLPIPYSYFHPSIYLWKIWKVQSTDTTLCESLINFYIKAGFRTTLPPLGSFIARHTSIEVVAVEGIQI